MKLQLLLLATLLATASAWTCTEKEHNECMDSRSYCWRGKVYKCPSGSFHCIGTGPCHTHNDNPVYPGWKRYSCIDNTHFANGRWSKMCAPGTHCWTVSSGNPCLAKKHTGTCPKGNMKCIDSKHYCQRGVIYTCPGNYRCAGSAPCVKRM